MLKENLLWTRAIDSDGRIHREETILAAALAFAGFLSLVVIIVAAVIYFQ